MSSPPYSLRPDTPADWAFLRALYGEGRAAELAQVPWEEGQQRAFLDWQFDLREDAYRRRYPEGEFSIIEVDGAPAGRLIVARLPDQVRVVDIAVAVSWQGRGIGGAVLADVIAAARPRPVRMAVEHLNPVRAWYERLGFVPIAALDEVYVELQLKTAS